MRLQGRRPRRPAPTPSRRSASCLDSKVPTPPIGRRELPWFTGTGPAPSSCTRRGEPVPVHVRVGDRGSPGQDRGPDLGRHPGRDPARRPDRPRGLRDPDHHRPGGGGRGDLHHDLCRHPQRGPPDHPRHRLRPGQVRLRRGHLRGHGGHRRAVARHRPGRRPRLRGARRRHRPARHPGRRRPGDDGRLRLQRDPRADAGPDRPGPPAVAPPGRGPALRGRPLPAPRRQDPGHRRVRGPQAGAAGHRGRVHPARPRRRHRDPARPRHPRARDRRRPPRGPRPPRACGCSSTRPAGSSWAAPTPTPA